MTNKSKYKYTLPLKWNDCRNSKKGKETFSVFGQQYACTSKKCKSIHCIRFQRNKEAKIRLVNYYLSPPDYFIVFRLENISFPMDWLMTKHFLKCFKKQLKDDSKSKNFEFDWEFLIEFDDYNNPHFHMAIKNKGNNGKQEIKSIFKRFLQEVWNKSISKFKRKYDDENKDNIEQIQKLNGVSGSVYCEKVISISGAAIYLSKGQIHIWKYNPVPEEWDTIRCHIVSRSRGFLVKPKKELLELYNQNKEFFWEWKSDLIKIKKNDNIISVMESNPIDSVVESDFNVEPIALETKKTTPEVNFKEESVDCAFKNENIAIATKDCIIKNPSSRTWINRILVNAAWGCALVGSLIFAINKIENLVEKPNFSVDLKSDHNQRAKFMQKWFLDNGFEYHQNE